jgi:hypothetical protein
MGDLERKTLRHISLPKGIETFDFCKRPSFLLTGGRDKAMYVELISEDYGTPMYSPNQQEV